MVSKGLRVLPVKGSCRGKHDGGVKVSNDARDSAGCCDAGLRPTIPSLKSCQHVRHLWGTSTVTRVAEQVQATPTAHTFSDTSRTELLHTKERNRESCGLDALS